MSHGARPHSTGLMAFSRERRAHIARKWHYIEGLSYTEIIERFEERGIASLARGTISNYINEESAEETKRLVRERMADEDLRMAESLQDKHDRSREAEQRATEDRRVEAVRPRSNRNTADHSIRVPGWRVLDSDERPDHAGPEDVFIEGTGGICEIPPGSPYYILDPAGNPRYETALVGVERDQPDLNQRKSLRYEQAAHLDQKAARLGIDDDSINVEVSGDLDVAHTVPDEVIAGMVGASHARLDSNADANADTDATDTDAEQQENEHE